MPVEGLHTRRSHDTMHAMGMGRASLRSLGCVSILNVEMSGLLSNSSKCRTWAMRDSQDRALRVVLGEIWHTSLSWAREA